MTVLGIAAAILPGVAAVRRPDQQSAIYPPTVGVIVLLFVVALVILNVLNRRMPRTLEAHPGAFATPRHGAAVLMGVSCWGFIAVCVSVTWIDIAAGGDRWWLLATLVAVPVAGAVTRLMWVGAGVRLTPDGLSADRGLSSLWVPWDGLDPEQPARPDADFTLRLRLARPELAQRRGWAVEDDVVPVEGADPHFVAQAISHYVAHPEHRAALGKAAELERLGAALPTSGSAAVAQPDDTPEPEITRIGLAVRVLLVAGAFGVKHEEPVPDWLDAIATGAVIFGSMNLFGHLATRARNRRRRRRQRATRSLAAGRVDYST
ncbi:hypothetical protein [Cryptosporangium minutisporangium]|uniref:Uncharacterized protein n=2 Tax=Cryptosporangium minutisporangium TaxID=113569 RepID=A0ABP6T6C6_9ACTN